MAHVALTAQDLKNRYRGVYKQLKMNDVYKVMSLETKSPVQPSSPHRCLSNGTVQRPGHLDRTTVLPRETSQMWVSEVIQPGTWQPSKELKFSGVWNFSLICTIAHLNIFCAEVIFIFLTESQVYEIHLSSGICHKLKAQNTTYLRTY